MKLSEAMMQGIGDTVQAFGSFMYHESCCALGAAIRGKKLSQGLNPDIWNGIGFYEGLNLARELFPEVTSTYVSSPEEASALYDADMHLYAVIVDLNDTWHWSRERIATWLEGIGL